MTIVATDSFLAIAIAYYLSLTYLADWELVLNKFYQLPTTNYQSSILVTVVKLITILNLTRLNPCHLFLLFPYLHSDCEPLKTPIIYISVFRL